MRWLALVLILVAAPAWAGPAEDAAVRATEVRDKHCADMAQDRTSGATGALVAVAPVLDEVSRAYDETRAPFLLYWRGVLFECTNQEARATTDLTEFVGSPENQSQLPQLVQDAHRRLRRLGTGAPAPPPKPTAARLTVALGGQYELLADDGPYHYGGLGLQGSLALVGPLRLLAFVRLSVGPSHEGVASPERSALVPWGVGLVARVGDDVALRVGGVATFSINVADDGGFWLLPGASAVIGGAFKLGPAPLELQPELQIGFLESYFHFRAGVSIAVRIGGS